MKVYVTINGGRELLAHAPHPGADHVIVENGICPNCGIKGPLKVAGTGIHTKTHDRYLSHAKCVGCGDVIGTIAVKVDTIFGIEEDERMLVHGRCRVY